MEFNCFLRGKGKTSDRSFPLPPYPLPLSRTFKQGYRLSFILWCVQVFACSRFLLHRLCFFSLTRQAYCVAKRNILRVNSRAASRTSSFRVILRSLRRSFATAAKQRSKTARHSRRGIHKGVRLAYQGEDYIPLAIWPFSIQTRFFATHYYGKKDKPTATSAFA